MNYAGRDGLKLIDKSFNPELSQHYHLSVEVSTYGFNYCVYDAASNKFVVLDSNSYNKIIAPNLIGDELSKCFSSDDILKITYKKTTIILKSTGSLIVPSAIYDENAKETFLRYHAPADNYYVINSDTLPAINAVNLYRLPEGIAEAVAEIPNKARILHSSSILITALFAKFKNISSENPVFIHAGTNYFDIAVLGVNGLSFFNSFKFKSAEDIIYYVLFVFEQLKLRQSDTVVYLLGEIDRDSHVFEILYKYILNLKFLERNKDFDYSYVMDSVKEHYCYCLFNSELCV